MTFLPILMAVALTNAQPSQTANRLPMIEATPFALSDVKLLGGVFETEHAIAARYLLQLDPARLLAGFRANSGLEPNAEIYGGWETGGLSGHSLGHFLTACSQEFARTGDVRYRDKVNAIIAGLAECQKERPDGFLMAFRFDKGFDRPRLDKIWSDVGNGVIHSGGFDLNGMWSPWYVHHKVLAGLLDAESLCGNKQALDVAKRFADWAYHETERLTEDQWQKMLACEYGGMNESLAELYSRTKNLKYLQLSRKFYDHRVLDPLKEGQDDLPGKHSNTQIPKIIGLARLYEITGEPVDGKAANFFWETVVNHHSYAIGGNSNGEYLGQPDQLAQRLSSNTCETCNTYNMLKLTRHLFEWSPDAKKMDFYELAYFNHILGSQDPETGGVTYFMPLATGSHRNYSDAFDDFTCCHGTGMENHTKHGDSAYFHAGANILWVNLFMPTELTWREAHLVLRQQTDFPTGGSVKITVESGHSNFEMRLRHPGWATGPIEYLINGKSFGISSTPSSYMSIQRTWKAGDRLEFRLPMTLHEQPMPDDANRVALMRGPIVLAADLGPTTGPNPRTPVLVTNNLPIARWLKPVADHPDRFVADDVARPTTLELFPFYSLHRNRYAVYFDKFSEAQWAKDESDYRAEDQRLKDLEARTIDQFAIGEMQPERDHHLTSEKNDVRDVNGRNFRTPMAGGWFEVVAKVSPTKPVSVVLTYWGNDRLRPGFELLANGAHLAHEDLTGRPLNRFYDVEYPIPSAMTAAKTEITLRIQPTENKSGPSVAGIRIITQKP